MSKSFLHGILLTCLFTSILLANDGNAQHKSMKEVIVSIDLEDATLRQMINALEAQTEFKFIYSGDFLTKTEAYKITLSADNKSVAHVLQQVASATGLLFQQNDGAIAVGTDDLKEEESPITLTEPVLEQDISGKVTDEAGQPLPGASVLVKGTSVGVITDVDGNYRISAPDEATTLVFSFVGYERKEVEIGGRVVVDVSLVLDVTTLGEITINAGYYEVNKREQTGNISKVTAQEIEKQPVGNPIGTLQGRVTGLQITQQTGVPGGGFEVRIRGTNSISSGNDPFYIIDGVPFISGSTGINETSASLYPGGLSPLNSINPANIESIEILKDADATAIYGSRGANGVILITTKNGESGKPRVDLNLYRGISKITRKMDLLNTEQYIEMRREALQNDGFWPLPPQFEPSFPDLFEWDTTRYTDWQKELIGGTAQITDGQLSISGGNNNIQYILGGGYRKETSVFPDDGGDERTSVNFKLTNTSLDKKFKMSFSINYGVNNTDLVNQDLTQIATSLPPNAPNIFEENGELNWENNTWDNPYALLKREYDAEITNLIGNATLNYDILPSLKIIANFGYSSRQNETVFKTPLSSRRPNQRAFNQNVSVFSNSNFRSWIVEPQLSWNKHVGKGHLNVLVGTTFQDQETEDLALIARGFSDEALMGNMSSASEIIPGLTNNYAQYRYTAIFGRINYNWMGKYIVNLTGRRDGSSRFGPGKQFANFGAIGAAWLFTNEEFIQNNLVFLSFGKLRVSYGVTGNDQIGDYRFLDSYRSSGLYQGQIGLEPVQLFNPDFAWETNKKMEAAIDLGFVQDRILVSVSYYRNRSSNQLLGRPLAPTTGFSSVLFNRNATVQNSGVEIELNTVNVKSQNFIWSTSLNFTIPRNKLVDYPNLERSPDRNRLVVGESLNIRKLFNYQGVNIETGEYEFDDVDDNGILTLEDRQTIKEIGQIFFGGLNNTIEYRGVQLDFLFQFVKQNGSNYLASWATPGIMGNQPIMVIDRWQQPGDITNVQRYNVDGSLTQSHSNAQRSDLSVSDASFVRLKNVSISYQLPQNWSKKLPIQNSRIFFQGQNLLTFTDFKGGDPESQFVQKLPPMRMYTAGINLSF